MSKQPRPVMLVIMDGWGLTEPGEGNAVDLAETPNVDRWTKECPYTTLGASGKDVGLPEGQIGNSEVGHLNIGAGRVVYQEFTRISKAIEDGDFFENAAFLDAIAHVKQHDSKLHLLGLFGPGGVHSYEGHLHALLKLAKQQGLEQVYLHLFLDGRDVAPRSALEFLDTLEQAIEENGIGQVATVGGRYYAMDRDKRWERTGRAYDAMVSGNGETAPDARTAIQQSYDNDVSDEFVLPTIIEHDGKPVALVQDGDAIIYTNFRPDRARQLSQAFTLPDVNERITKHYDEQKQAGQKLPDTIWQRDRQFDDLYYVTMTEYENNLPVHVAFKPNRNSNTLSEVVGHAGRKQLHMAETEKYPHVTFFLNGGREIAYDGEDWKMINSPKVATYDLQPEMSAEGVTELLLERIKSDQYDLIVINYANPDMVGHTGKIPAVITACETVDADLGRVIPAMMEQGGAAIIIADHGNAEVMIDPETGGPHTAHTTNPVPCILVTADDLGLGKDEVTLRSGGRLADIAPTLLDLMGIEPPEEMTGKTLVER